VKKEITLTANPDSQDFDFAALGLVQQALSTVPEPGTMAALGVGIAALIARRKKGSR
jgi:hypothetical protein